MKDHRYGSIVVVLLLCSALLVSFSLLSGCKGSSGAAGSSSGSISGVVTNATATTVPVAGVTVSTMPDVGSTTTDANGNYSMSLPAGSYTITFAKTNFTSVTAAANVAVGTSTQINASLGVSSAGIPSLTLTSSATSTYVGYGAAFTVTSTVNNPIGNTLTYKWKSATAGTDQTTATATTPALNTALTGSTAASTDPGGYVAGYNQETRIGVLPITADTRGAKTVSLTVDDGQGAKGTGSITVNAAGIQPGLKTVALGVPVYLNSGTTNTSTWTVAPPSGSGVPTTLSTGRNPSFTPDVVGPYVVTATTPTVYTMTIYAGKWNGAINTSPTTTYTTKVVTSADGMWYGWAPSATQSSFTYTNWPVVEGDPGCLGCHNGGSALDLFTPWKNTVHATFFARGLENITSNGGTCLTCHTTGYDTIANNNDGFDDMAKAEGFVYTASTKATGAWAKLLANDPKTAQRSNIQCENCHGPQTTSTSPFDSSGAHQSSTNGAEASPNAYRISYKSEVCASCHASGTGHHFYSEWVSSINPDTATATSVGYGHSKNWQLDAFVNPLSPTGDVGHARSMDGSCSRCHTAQGFVAYMKNNIASGNSGTLAANLITWTKANAEPQTCVTCHDPHSDQYDNQLRSYNSVTMTMAGFGVDGVGKGSLCMICHNNRNGIQCASAPTGTGACPGGVLSPTGATFLHEDAATNGALGAAPDPSNPDSYLDSMHDASQAEVLMGRNFFFMGNALPMLSKHANVEDTCVGCHMTLNPQTHLSHGAPAVSSHVFYIKDADVATLCANCHSSSVNGEALQTFVEDQLDVLGQKMADNFVSQISSYLTGTPDGIYLGGKASGQIHSAATATYSDGSFWVTGTLTSGLTTTTIKVSLTNVTKDSTGIQPLITPDSVLKKANWNWTMIERDGSKGIHNPTLIQQVLTNTIAQFQ